MDNPVGPRVNPVHAARPRQYIRVVRRAVHGPRNRHRHPVIFPQPAIVPQGRRNPIRKCRRQFKCIPKKFKVPSRFLLAKLDKILAANRRRGKSSRAN